MIVHDLDLDTTAAPRIIPVKHLQAPNVAATRHEALTERLRDEFLCLRALCFQPNLQRGRADLQQERFVELFVPQRLEYSPEIQDPPGGPAKKPNR